MAQHDRAHVDNGGDGGPAYTGLKYDRAAKAAPLTLAPPSTHRACLRQIAARSSTIAPAPPRSRLPAPARPRPDDAKRPFRSGVSLTVSHAHPQDAVPRVNPVFWAPRRVLEARRVVAAVARPQTSANGLQPCPGHRARTRICLFGKQGHQEYPPNGKNLIQDARDIVETARVMVHEKNADELFQNLVWHTRDVDVDAAKKGPNQVLHVYKDKAKDDGQLAVQHLLRRLLSDFSLIGRDLHARGACKAADGLRPDAEALVHVDESVPNDQFVTAGGRTSGPNETPVLEARVPGDHARELWFKSVDAYLRKDLTVLAPGCNSRGNAIRDSRRQSYDGKYKGHFDNLFSSVGTFFKAMGNDSLNGSLKFKLELWGDIRKVILPTLVDKVGYIPIPRIECTDDLG
ncbi:hypothetical protein FIBSPDRAFT_953335 [Athelia psychrophila]|uniref:HAM1-like N-terminal domain-containing protein n=1 Tax=Athelia psychrophila TaxID=1759441 RepID=A0A166KD64_9AGAM|nr:hypothetical protein FIBSPDRAFT_953335 [Fibularhizoctonia sp. CBS 109695]